MSEYWKIEGAPVSEELKRMVLVDNFHNLHEKHW
jgi:hypothetical protein